MRHLLLAAAVWLALALPSYALTAEEEAAVERMRAYLNHVTTLQASFAQVDSNGKRAKGRFWLHRPHRLRFEYDAPDPILIVARGSHLVYFDKELKETTYLDQADTPAWFLLADEIQLGDDVRIDDVVLLPDRVEITATQQLRNGEGQVTLIFDRAPARLRGWYLQDPAGGMVQVSLLDQQVGIAIDPERFNFRPTDYGPTGYD